VSAATTVIISPRDRYSGLAGCIERLFACTPEKFELWVLDLGYPQDDMVAARALIEGKPNCRVIDLGLVTPMDALRSVRADVATPTVVLLDNDSRVTPGWLAPLLGAVDAGASVVSPLILEREGLDEGGELRNHLYTGELRVVDVDGTPYLIEQKHFRRADVDAIPREQAPTRTFELHCVMFRTSTFLAIELPSMVVREHLDIALQVLARKEKLVVEPASVVTFDNLATPMRLADMRFFFYRWSNRLIDLSAHLFEARWGYRFYSELAMRNWAFRRKVFLLSRWIGMPIGWANTATSAAKRLFCKDWDPLPDAEGASRSFGAEPPAVQLSHRVQ
jgi:hypothetical protein